MCRGARRGRRAARGTTRLARRRRAPSRGRRGRPPAAVHPSACARDPTGRRADSPGAIPFRATMLQRYNVRASDLDRERAVEFLKAHYADGRLREDELAWRTDAAYRAVTLSDLDRLTADLPAFAPRAPARRRVSPVALVLLAAFAVAIVVAVPPETWLVMLVVFVPLMVLACILVAPIAVPLLLLAWIAHVISRATRPRPRHHPPHRVGWR